MTSFFLCTPSAQTFVGFILTLHNPSLLKTLKVILISKIHTIRPRAALIFNNNFRNKRYSRDYENL